MKRLTISLVALLSLALAASATAQFRTPSVPKPAHPSNDIRAIYFGGDTPEYRQRPTDIHLTSDENLTHLTWTTWGSFVAVGEGQADFGSELPRPSVPVLVSLRNVTYCGLQRRYLDLTIHYLKPQSFGSELKLHFKCEGPR